MEPTTDQAATDQAAETATPKIQAMRRQPCPCGSGKKFKNCHIDDPAYEVAAEPADAQAAPVAAAGKGQHPGAGGKQHFPMQQQRAAQSQRFSNAMHRRKV